MNTVYVRTKTAVNELTTHTTTNGFPSALCLATEDGYLPLDEPGVDFDSGLRLTLDNGHVYQVCSALTGNLLTMQLVADNLIVPLDDIGDAYSALAHVLGKSRVKLGNGGAITVLAPAGKTMITQLLLFGAGIELQLDNNVTLKSNKNGWNISQVGGDKQRLGRVLLLKLVPGRRFTLTVDNSGWPDDEEPVHAGIALGYTVEALPKAVTTVEPVCNAPSWCMWIHGRGLVYVTDDPVSIDTWRSARERIAYKGGNKKCSYFSMTDVKTVNKRR